MRKVTLLILLFSLLVGLTAVSAQTYDLQFVVETNDGFNGGNFDVKIQIKANTSTFGMGNANLVFEYNTDGLSGATLQTAHNFSGTFYNTMTVTEPTAGRISTNIELFVPNFGTTVTLTYMDVATIRFTIDDFTQSSQLVWRTTSPNETQVFDHDLSTLITAGALNGEDVALPVTLSSFSAKGQESAARLDWSTESEINNLGFEVYRSLEEEGEYQLIGDYDSHNELRGHGSTNEVNNYFFLDKEIAPGLEYFYKIADIDFNGVRSYHGPVSVVLDVDGLVATSTEVPKAFKLYQNYPNPFNPKTTLEFDIPLLSDGNAEGELVVYNALGQPVKELFRGRLVPGSFRIEWNGLTDSGNAAPSGIYFAAFRMQHTSQVIKMIMVQ